MKKSVGSKLIVTFLVLTTISLLSISFVSASFLYDAGNLINKFFEGKITGNAVSGTTSASFNSFNSPWDQYNARNNQYDSDPCRQPPKLISSVTPGDTVTVSGVSGTLCGRLYPRSPMGSCINNINSGCTVTIGLTSADFDNTAKVGFYNNNQKLIKEYSLRDLQKGVKVPAGATLLYAFQKEPCEINSACYFDNNGAYSVSFKYTITPSCTPTTCSNLGKICGSWSDGCNGTLDCGGCDFGLACSNGNCVTINNFDLSLNKVYTWSSYDSRSTDPYLLGLNLCVYGDKSITDLNLGLTGIPFSYKIMDQNNNIVAQLNTSVSGDVLSIKNGQCSSFATSIQSQHHSLFDNAKEISFYLDYNNVIKEINELNNNKELSLTKSIFCTDSDGGLNYYIKGSIYTNANQWISPSGDSCGINVQAGQYNNAASCSGDNCYIHEYSCEGQNPVNNAPVKCPNGCNDGACVNSTLTPYCKYLYWFDDNSRVCGYKQFCDLFMYKGLETFETKEACEAKLNPPINNTCTDSDGGVSYYVKGSVFTPNELSKSKNDTCYIQDLEYPGRNYIGVSSCTGDNCYVDEWSCDSQTASSTSDLFKCPNGCKDGACIRSFCGNGICEDGEANIQPTCNQGQVCTQNIIVGTCPQDCQNNFCTDSDNGKNKYVSGTTCFEGNCKTDTCNKSSFGESYVIENYCYNKNNPSDMYMYCANDCINNSCIRTTLVQNGVCQNLTELVANPSDIVINNKNYSASNWNYNYSGSWWINNIEERYNEYSASWNSPSDNSNNEYSNINVELTIFDNATVNLSNLVKERTSYQVCQIDSYWDATNKENIIYVCNWDILRNKQDLNNYEYKSRQVFWVNNNVMVKLYVSSGRSLTNDEIEKITKKRANEFLNDLRDNTGEYIDSDNFEITYLARSFIDESLRKCSSQLVRPTQEGTNETCSPSWTCKLEPSVCPEYGYQKKICVDNGCNNAKREEQIDCSPGICSGCYVPRWYSGGYGNNDLDNICIPYGTRLELSDGEKGKISQAEASREIKEINFTILPENTAELVLLQMPNEIDHITANGMEYKDIGDRMVVYPRNQYKVEIYFTDSRKPESAKIKVNNIKYSQNPEESYIEIEFLDTYNAYCNYDGNINQQKTVDYNGDWAKCQNNYECESNLCSSGECVEVQKMLKEASSFKVLGVKILCKLGHLFSVENYNSCISDRLGPQYINASNSE